jgi:hypothetical protein
MGRSKRRGKGARGEPAAHVNGTPMGEELSESAVAEPGLQDMLDDRELVKAADSETGPTSAATGGPALSADSALTHEAVTELAAAEIHLGGGAGGQEQAQQNPAAHAISSQPPDSHGYEGAATEEERNLSTLSLDAVLTSASTPNDSEPGYLNPRNGSPPTESDAPAHEHSADNVDLNSVHAVEADVALATNGNANGLLNSSQAVDDAGGISDPSSPLHTHAHESYGGLDAQPGESQQSDEVLPSVATVEQSALYEAAAHVPPLADAALEESKAIQHQAEGEVDFAGAAQPDIENSEHVLMSARHLSDTLGSLVASGPQTLANTAAQASSSDLAAHSPSQVQFASVAEGALTSDDTDRRHAHHLLASPLLAARGFDTNTLSSPALPAGRTRSVSFGTSTVKVWLAHACAMPVPQFLTLLFSEVRPLPG